MDRCYFDYNATSPLCLEAREAMISALKLCGNPSSPHQHGRDSLKIIQQARESLAKSIDCKIEEITFTASGTEANYIALFGVNVQKRYFSAVEHPSVNQYAFVNDNNPNYHFLSVDLGGQVNLEQLKVTLSKAKAPFLVSVMMANNETGVIQPVKEIANIVHNLGGIIHCDAVQAFGKIPLSFANLDVDLLTLSAHKFGGPKGVGILVVKEGTSIAPILHGGGQEKGLRPGTENIAGINGCAHAAKWAIEQLEHFQNLNKLRDNFESKILEFCPEATIFGKNHNRLPNTSFISMPNVSSETQLMLFDLDGFSISAGSACSSGKSKKSMALKAMGISDQKAGSAIRVSFGWSTTEENVERFIDCWKKIYNDAQSYLKVAV